MESTRNLAWISAAALAAALAAGCDQNAPSQSVSKMDQQTGGKMNQNLDQAASGLKQEAQSLGEAVGDTAITAKVKTAMAGQLAAKAELINVDTSNGVVTLTGAVESQQMAEKAMQVAQAVTGVKSVENRLSVKTTG